MTTKKIDFFDYPALFLQRRQEYINALTEVMSRGAYIMQQDLFDFEQTYYYNHLFN